MVTDADKRVIPAVFKDILINLRVAFEEVLDDTPYASRKQQQIANARLQGFLSTLDWLRKELENEIWDA